MRTPEQIAAKQTERLQRELTLTPQQRDTVYAIHLKYARMRSPEATHEEVQSRNYARCLPKNNTGYCNSAGANPDRAAMRCNG